MDKSKRFLGFPAGSKLVFYFCIDPAGNLFDFNLFLSGCLADSGELFPVRVASMYLDGSMVRHIKQLDMGYVEVSDV